MRAADILAHSLRAHGVDRLFCVPGESYLALLDALTGFPDIDLVVCRHEGGAGLMAVADAKLTGRCGVVAVSRGPGAANAAIALHLAQQDAAPLVVLIGQVARSERGRGAFQEVDYGQMFGGVAKGVWEVHDAARLSEAVARAFHVACTGAPGPVVLALPEDMLEDMGPDAVVAPLPVPAVTPAQTDVDRALAMLSQARRPLLIAGGALSHAEGRAALADAARALGAPVALAFKRQEIFDNASPLYAGYLGFKIPRPLVEALSQADLVVAVGCRLGDVTTQGYTFPRAPAPAQPLIHVYPDPAAIGSVFRTDLGLPCDPVAFLRALAARRVVAPEGRAAWVRDLHARTRALRDFTPQEAADGVDFGLVAQALAAQAPRDAILSLDSGNFSSWVHRLWPWDGAQTCIGAVGGAMGLGVPGAVAACLRHPGRRVIAFVGDGGALMTGAELAVARARGAKPLIVVADNAAFGTIRQHQERAFPGRVSGTALVNPDFAAWGAAFGALGLTIAAPGEAEGAVAQALAHDGPVVLHVRSSLEAISAYATLSGMRAAP